MEENEIWKKVRNFPDYEVSNFGKIRNKKTGRVLKQKTDRDGYKVIHLNNDRITRKIHRLVADTFIPNPENKPIVNHLDGNKSNNNVYNLEWCTARENTRHSINTGLYSSSTSIRDLKTNKEYKSISECARDIGCDRRRIGECVDINHPRTEYDGRRFEIISKPEKTINPIPIKITETGQFFRSISECASYYKTTTRNVLKKIHDGVDYNGIHFEFADTHAMEYKKTKQFGRPFLYEYQMDAVNRIRNGSILCGSVGSGKSRTSLFWYFKECGGWIDENGYVPMKNPKDLYIITTAKKRNTLEWDEELVPFLLYPDENRITRYGNKIIVNSWNQIGKYKDVKDAIFILDEQRLVSYGAWTKAFLKIAKNNKWILLSATPGDSYIEYLPVFLGNGFFRNKSEFLREHVRYSPYVTKYPKIEGYYNTKILDKMRDDILVTMDYIHNINKHNMDVYCSYNIATYKDVMKKRWDIYKEEPITQASGLCYVLRRVVNSDESRQVKLLEILENHPRVIIFYNFTYELEILRNLAYGEGVEVAEYNGQKHQDVPKGDKWVYLCQYTAACEGWSCITTNCIVFFSQNYSYKVTTQAAGRIDRLTTPYKDLYYYHLRSRSGIDLAITRALNQKKKFNERKFTKWDA